ncbi:DUF2770 domain-containing protein [Shigella dysenteriae]|nr:DUF2770 domain-containing protein [Shigella dysenteriae]
MPFYFRKECPLNSGYLNNIREHLMLYLFLWGLLAIMDLIYVFYF